MDYLSNYYKNLCEQLQEKLNILEAQLNEFNYGPGGIKIKPSGGPYKFDGNKSMPIFPRDERNPNNPDGPPVGREGEEGYWEPDLRVVGPNYKPRDTWVPSKRKPGLFGKSTDENTPSNLPPFHKVKKTGRDDLNIPRKGIGNKFGDTEIPLIGERLPDHLRKMLDKGAGEETDDDIYAMRQTAADQGGIPQNMVNEPINRTKQMPDGTLIHSQTPTRLQMKPKPGLQVKPNIPLPAPKDETMIPMSLKGLRDEISFNKKEYKLIPPPRKDLMS